MVKRKNNNKITIKTKRTTILGVKKGRKRRVKKRKVKKRRSKK